MFLALTANLSAQERIGSFIVDPVGSPSVIFLDGEIDLRSALSFRRALAASPHSTTVALNSAGGLVQIALLISEEIHERGLNTYIPEHSTCASACSLIFLAGRDRRADGRLGVHQLSQDVPDISSAQITISDMIEMLHKYGTSAQVFALMFRTPADQMHFFSPQELELLAINRNGGDVGRSEVAKRTDERYRAPIDAQEKPSKALSIDGLLRALQNR